MVGQCGNDPTMKMTEELQQIVPARQGDFGTARLNGDDAETGGVAKTLRVDGLGEARRVQGGAQDAGTWNHKSVLQPILRDGHGACHRARIRATRWWPPQDEVYLVETQQPHAEERATR